MRRAQYNPQQMLHSRPIFFPNSVLLRGISVKISNMSGTKDI